FAGQQRTSAHILVFITFSQKNLTKERSVAFDMPRLKSKIDGIYETLEASFVHQIDSWPPLNYSKFMYLRLEGFVSVEKLFTRLALTKVYFLLISIASCCEFQDSHTQDVI